DKNQNDDHDSMVKHFSKLEIDHLNFQLNYQNLKENIGNSKSKTSKDVPEFDVFFEINKKEERFQEHRNTIHKLKAQISQMKVKSSDMHGTLDNKALDSQNLQLKETVSALSTTSTSGPTVAVPQAINALVKYDVVCTNQLDPNSNWRSDLPNFPFFPPKTNKSWKLASSIKSFKDSSHHNELAKKYYSSEAYPGVSVEDLHFIPSSMITSHRVHIKTFALINEDTYTDNDTEFVNQLLSEYYESVGISHQKTVLRTPHQNGVVKRRNRTLVEAAHTMLIFSKALMFLWAEVIATACFTQNISLIHTLHNKTPYELVHDKKLDLLFFFVFGALCYPTNDSEDLGKLKAKADIVFFVGYAPNKKG
ncbi:retrovirus-related pol polyprotein from transposon TNT 1-94, partial [Tanacetum coccineum]